MVLFLAAGNFDFIEMFPISEQHIPGLVLAWLDCSIYGRHPAGTQTIYVGLVVASNVPRPDEPPLVYWNRGCRQLETGNSRTPIFLVLRE